jgi:hypothetical protein
MELPEGAKRAKSRRFFGISLYVAIGASVFALGFSAPQLLRAPADAAPRPMRLPPPPTDGVMGFVIENVIPPVIQGKDACPRGTSPKLREAYLDTLPAAERERLLRKENEAELTRLWQAGVFGPNGSNICSQPELFPGRPLLRTVQSKLAWGLDLDQGASGEGCAHDTFQTPTGERGIDNQEYRALGCTLEWRGTDGIKGDIASGMHQFIASGEWTQVILLRGVDSLENDSNVEVVLGNTADRPQTDSKGNFLPGASFTVSDTPPRHRNALRGKIVGGVLTTEPADIVLAQTWGQGGARDIRGNRTKFDYRRARLRLAFQSDGSVRGMLGGYRPLFDLIHSPAIGGAGSAVVAGIDCAAYLSTFKKLADGLRDPNTGECKGISAALQISAIPAFVNDIAPTRTAQR